MLALVSEREVSGYDVKRAVDRSVGYLWAPARSGIYAVLPRLVERGLARRREVVEQGRTRHLYRITSRGRRALVRWLREPPEPDPGRNPLLLKIFFGRLIDDATILELVRAKRAEAEGLKRALTAFDAAVTDPELDRFPAYTRWYGHEWADAVIRWADAVEADVASRRRRQAAAART